MIKIDKIIRSRRKTLALSVDEFGRLTVRAPVGVSEERIFSFVTKKEKWIREKQTEKRAFLIQMPDEDLNGYAFSLLGKSCSVRLTDERAVRFDADAYELFVPRTQAMPKLVRWLQSTAEGYFQALTAKKAEEMQVTVKKVSISKTRGCWGQCSKENEIKYSYRALFMPREVTEYLVVHELAHIRHKNHSAQFWAEVQRFAPDFKTSRKKLKDRGIYMHLF